MPVADEPGRHRTLSRRGQPCAGGRTRRARCASPGSMWCIISQWTDPKENDRCIGWCRDTYKALGPYLGKTRYVNYLDADEDGDPQRRLRRQLRAPARAENQVRPRQRVSHQREHQAALEKSL